MHTKPSALKTGIVIVIAFALVALMTNQSIMTMIVIAAIGVAIIMAVVNMLATAGMDDAHYDDQDEPERKPERTAGKVIPINGAASEVTARDRIIAKVDDSIPDDEHHLEPRDLELVDPDESKLAVACRKAALGDAEAMAFVDEEPTDEIVYTSLGDPTQVFARRAKGGVS